MNKTLIIPLAPLGPPGGLLLASLWLLDPPSPFTNLLLSLCQFSGLLGGLYYGFGLLSFLQFLDSLNIGGDRGHISRLSLLSYHPSAQVVC